MQLVTMQFYFLMLFLPVLSNTTNDFFGLTRSKRGSKTTFLEKPECSNMKRFCEISNDPDDLSVLECLHSLHPNDLAALTPQCQQIVWEKTNQLIKDESILELLFPVCRIDMTRLNCKIDDGDYFKCLASGKDNIEDKSCLEIIGRVENVAFTDYKFLAKFLYHCESDVQELKCGKIDSQDLSQIKTIACLQSNILQVTDNCKREVFRLSELQSDNIKLDQQLYMDCVEDYSKYCSQFVAGSGRVFHCLLRQDPQKLSSKCKESLSRREKLISQDYKISRGLMRACKEDIKKSHCRKQTSNDKTVRLAQILLCLENIVKNGSRIVPDCEAELVEHRRMLMEDYRLSPEIVDKCKKEISVFCKGFQTGGNTIHCLMKHAREKDDTFGKRCQAALEDLIKQTDVGENWNVDPVLHKACSPVVTKICKDITSGEARVINCLMDNIGAYYMTEDCEDALIQIQYFISRRFELDDQLYRACKADATRLCHVSSDWDSQGESGSGVLPCLFRYVDPEDRSLQVNRSCLQNIRRVMRQRALSVDLEPAIEESCLSDLGTFCHDRVAKGEEMKCLQEKYNSLEDKCRETIGLLTEFQAEHIELNPYIKKFCSKIMDDLCSKEATHDEGDVMECLISHKNDPVVKANQACKGSIEHFQLISLNDYKYLATGASFKTLGYSFRMSDVTVGRIVKETSKAIWETLRTTHMPFPSTFEQVNSIKQQFWNRWRFPNCVGCIDGKHVRIRNPRHSGSMFRNYKQFFSIVLQGVAGPDYKFIAVDVGGYGKESDGGIFSNSNLSKKLEAGALGTTRLTNLPGTNIKVPYVILGDEAYPLKTYLMRPFPGENLTPSQRIFNQRLSKARQVIECTFGIMSSKWRLLQKGIEVEPDFVDLIVKCICLLHNIVIDKESEQEAIGSRLQQLQSDTTQTPARFASLGQNRSSTSAYIIREKCMSFFCEHESVD